MVSNFRLKVEFDPKNRFLGIVARKPSMGPHSCLFMTSQAKLQGQALLKII
jgi:hypothetical protein